MKITKDTVTGHGKVYHQGRNEVTRAVAAGGRRDEGDDAQEGEDLAVTPMPWLHFGYWWEFLPQRQKPGWLCFIIVSSSYSFS